MKKIRHTESQMVKAIHQLEQGITAEVVCREYGVSRGTLYNWRCKYGGMDMSQIKKLKELEPEKKKSLATYICSYYKVSISRACRLLSLHRSYFYYNSMKDDKAVEEAIKEASKFGDGFWKIFSRLRNAGKLWNHKKVYRVYKEMHFNKKRVLKRRLPARVKHPLLAPVEPNKTWSTDFASDSLEGSRKFRVLNIIDDYNREAITQEISISFPADRLIRTLEKVIWMSGKPANLCKMDM